MNYPEFNEIVEINRRVVNLTGDAHFYDADDAMKIRGILEDLEAIYNDLEPEEQITRKAALLIHRMASGQCFHEGNKRTALIAAQFFLRQNGYDIDIKDKELLTVLDRSAILTATLKDVYPEIRRLIKHDRR